MPPAASPRASLLERAARIAPGGHHRSVEDGCLDSVRFALEVAAFSRFRFRVSFVESLFYFFAEDFFIHRAFARELRGRARFHFGRCGASAAFQSQFAYAFARF